MSFFEETRKITLENNSCEIFHKKLIEAIKGQRSIGNNSAFLWHLGSINCLDYIRQQSDMKGFNIRAPRTNEPGGIVAEW